MEDSFMFMPVVIALGFFAMIVWVVWLGVNAKNRRAQMQAEVQSKLIERFSTSKEFIEFLQSSAGQRFVSGVEVTTAIYARDRVIRGFGSGIVLSLLGLGFLAIAVFSRDDWGIYPGFILLALGLGFFASAFVSLKLSKSYGLVNGDKSPESGS
jgi:hypothetical protein